MEELAEKIGNTFDRDNPYLISMFESEIDKLDSFRDFMIILMRGNHHISFEYLYAIFFKYFKELSFEDWICILKALIKTARPYPVSLDNLLKSAYVFLEIDFYTELEKLEDLDEEWKEMWLKSVLGYPAPLSKNFYPSFFGKTMNFEPDFFSEITDKLVSEGAIKAEEIIIHPTPMKTLEFLTPFPPTIWHWAKKYKRKL